MSARSSQGALFSGLQEGALVLADISGYSRFVAQTEVDHSWSILHELLDTMVRSLAGRMDVSQVEGDAILFISGLSTAEVIKALEETFVAFHRRLRDMEAVTTCPCNACANIGLLKLKFVVHHGTFSRQRLGNVEQLHGTDVIAAHRLLACPSLRTRQREFTDAVERRWYKLSSGAPRCPIPSPHRAGTSERLHENILSGSDNRFVVEPPRPRTG